MSMILLTEARLISWHSRVAGECELCWMLGWRKSNVSIVLTQGEGGLHSIDWCRGVSGRGILIPRAFKFRLGWWHIIINRPGVAGAVLQSPPSVINWLSDGLWKYIQSTVNPKPEELESWNFEKMFIPHYVSPVTCPKTRRGRPRW